MIETILLLVATFLVAFGVGMAVGLVSERETRPTASPLHARDIYSTVHMPEGDFDSLPPSRVDINGAMTTYYFPFKSVPFSGEISRVGLHMNGVSTECRVNPPVTVRRGDSLTVIQPVGMDRLTAADPPEEATP